MEKVRLGRTEILATRTAFGALPLQRQPVEEVTKLLRHAYDSGINFYDTARMYSDSEEKIGIALGDVRDKIFISSKTHQFTAAQVRENLETSLRNLKTDYIDLMQVHNPPFCPRPGGEDGVYDELLKAKQEGKIRHIGLTNHREHIAREAVESGLYETLQFPFSYLSSASELQLKQVCIEADMGFLAMKPFGGGVMASGAAVYWFFMQHRDVVPLYGMQHMHELEEMLGYTDNPPQEAEVAAIIEEDRRELSGNFCRNCGYCAPCPIGIRTDMVLRSYYNLRRMPLFQMMTEDWYNMMKVTEDCIACGSCSSKCPYELDPPSRFEALRADFFEHWAAYHKT
ncbi:MAG: aldo/keto reductase [Clostridiales bacterium]|nr:aldo/keto reductase [Clostridiales bacterium]